MKGFPIAEAAHIVNILPPVDITGGVTGDIFSMKGHSHATIIIQVGVSASAFTKILVNECSDFSGTGATAIPFRLYAEETANGDTLGEAEEVESTGKTPSANNDIMYVIELDAADLSADKPYVQLQLTNGTNSVIASAVAILSGARYGGPQSATAIA